MLLKSITLALMAVFYVCYFSKMISQRKQGIRTDQLGRGKVGLVKWIEVALKTATYLLPVGQILSIILYTETVHPVIRITGVVLLALGVAAFILSVLQMRDNWRAGVAREDKTDLVTSGIYSVSRNPAFLGFDLMYIGILCAFFNLYLCLATAVALLLFHLQITKVEEIYLTETFGDEYRSYRKKVCRYFGRKFRHERSLLP